jgi:hypothetical protein
VVDLRGEGVREGGGGELGWRSGSWELLRSGEVLFSSLIWHLGYRDTLSAYLNLSPHHTSDPSTAEAIATRVTHSEDYNYKCPLEIPLPIKRDLGHRPGENVGRPPYIPVARSPPREP